MNTFKKSLVMVAAVMMTSIPAWSNPANSNSAVNKTTTPTATDQSNAPADLEMTRKIRSQLVSDKTLSTNAHNVKIITQNGKVTLVGPVASANEKAKVESLAKTVAGNWPVDSQITISK